MDTMACTTPARPTAAAPPATPPEATRRLSHLFRRSMSSGDIHPLLPALRLHHGVADGLGAAAPGASTPSPPAPVAHVDVAALQRGIGALPSLPQAVQQAMAILNDEGASVASAVESIEHDPVLAARTLRAANTAFYGCSGRVATLRAAVGILGLRTVVALLTTAAVSAQFRSTSRSPAVPYGPFWRHALTTALIARGLAKARGMDAEVAFTAGLLHDIGMLLLATQFPAEYGKAVGHATQFDLPLLSVERAVLSLDHCVAGEALSRHWRLPALVTQAIAAHHAPASGIDAAAGMVELVHVADALARGVQSPGGVDDAVPAVAINLWARIDPGTLATAELLRSTSDAVEALCEALSL